MPRPARPGGRRDSKGFALRVMLGIAMIGCLIAWRDFIVFMNKLNPLQGLIIWYGLFACALLMIFGGRTVTISGVGSRTIGLLEVAAVLMVYWAFRIVVGVESPWAAQATEMRPETVPPVMYQSEDGVTYSAAYSLFRFLEPYFPNPLWKTYPEFIAFMTYVIAPMVLIGLAAALLSAKQFKAIVRRAAAP